MAKSTTVLTTLARFAHVGWVSRLNSRHEYALDSKEGRDLEQSLVDRAWDKGRDPVIVETIDGSVEPGDLKAEILSQRQGVWDVLKSKARESSDALKELDIFEMIMTKDGKLIEPLYVGITGNRRSSLYLKAMAKRNALEEFRLSPDLSESDDAIPIQVRRFRDKLERLQVQQSENEVTGRGFLPMSDKERLEASDTLIQSGMSQSGIRKLYGATMGQKLYWYCVLDKRFPGLGLLDRALHLAPDNDRYIPFKSIAGKELPILGVRSDSEALDKHNRSPKEKTKLDPLTEDELEEYFTTLLREGRKNERKILDKDSIKRISETSGNPAVRAMARAVYNNDTSELDVWNKIMGPSVTILNELHEDGDLPMVEELLKTVKAVKRDSRIDAIKHMLAVVNGQA